MSKINLEQEIDDFIRQSFEQNFEELRRDAGHSITPDAKEMALQQVLLYWRKLQEIANNVVDTEVRLSLPCQKTTAGRDYTIEGVVDIVRADEKTILYDIKTHNDEYVRANLGLFEDQLNVYAYIWKELRGQDLDETAVIATDLPESVQAALNDPDPKHLQHALDNWNPVIKIEYKTENVQHTINEFGQVVDAIAENQFTPPPVEKLKSVIAGSKGKRFATYVCRNCDARFSCSSFRSYAKQSHSVAERNMSKFYGEDQTDAELETWRVAHLDAALPTDELERDFIR